MPGRPYVDKPYTDEQDADTTWQPSAVEFRKLPTNHCGHNYYCNYYITTVLLWWLLLPNRCVCVCVCVHAQSPLTLCYPSSVHGISQVRILEQVAISYSRGSSWSRDQTCLSYISCIGRQILFHCTTWEAPLHGYMTRSCNKHSAKLSSCFFYAPGAHSPNPLPTQQSECLI